MMDWEYSPGLYVGLTDVTWRSDSALLEGIEIAVILIRSHSLCDIIVWGVILVDTGGILQVL